MPLKIVGSIRDRTEAWHCETHTHITSI
jgi:hypothetical protein